MQRTDVHACETEQFGLTMGHQEFPCADEAVSRTRRFIRKACVAAGIASSDVWELVMSELATNAVCHARTKFVVTWVSPSPGRMWVQVRDYSERLPVQRDANPEEDESGRGLVLVSELAEHHVEKLPDGKIVCVEVIGDAA